MMAAVQPFLSGAISKTVNVPENYTSEDIAETYLESWRLGLKAVAVYRDGCKQSQPLSTSLDEDNDTDSNKPQIETVVEYRPVRRKLPIERHAWTHKFSVGGHDGYVTVGLYDDGNPGEIFIVMAKEGSTISGLMDAFATAVSLALQYGVPMNILTKKFCHMRFEPSGFTGNPDIPIAKSILDYIFRWLELKFCQKEEDLTALALAENDPATAAATATTNGLTNNANAALNTNGVGLQNETKAQAALAEREHTVFVAQADAPPCHNCGSMMVRSGSCYKCFNCGATSGCS
jgi:ribonucleoside-diphosphate reductase alpha chain